MRGTEQVLVDTFTILNNSRKNFYTTEHEICENDSW